MMEIVKACCENQEMVIVKYDENDEDLFLCGYIKHYNEEEVIMKCVNERRGRCYCRCGLWQN